MSNKLKLQNQQAHALDIQVEGIDDHDQATEKSVDSGTMVNEQINATLELLNKIEQCLKLENAQDTVKILKQRRKSTGNVSLLSIFKNEPNDKQQMNSFAPRADLTMMTEIEYLKCLQDNGSVIVQDANESSFFKGTFINVEKSESAKQAENQSKDEEKHALKDLNDEYLAKIT